MEVNGAKVPIVLQNIFLCVQQKKETQTGLQQLEGEVNDDTIFIFGWSIPLIKNEKHNLKRKVFSVSL